MTGRNGTDLVGRLGPNFANKVQCRLRATKQVFIHEGELNSQCLSFWQLIYTNEFSELGQPDIPLTAFVRIKTNCSGSRVGARVAVLAIF